MAGQDPDTGAEPPEDTNLTSFGEPLWLDALKTIGVGLTYLLVVLAIGGALAIAIIAPWGRASPDCSIYCVLEQYMNSLLSDTPENR